MSLTQTLSGYWLHIQEELLPWLNDTTCGPLNEHHKQLVSVLGMARIEAFLPGWPGVPGRPLSERSALARAFVAKAVFNFSTTRLLIEMLSTDKTLRRLCGWQREFRPRFSLIGRDARIRRLVSWVCESNRYQQQARTRACRLKRPYPHTGSTSKKNFCPGSTTRPVAR